MNQHFGKELSKKIISIYEIILYEAGVHVKTIKGTEKFKCHFSEIESLHEIYITQFLFDRLWPQRSKYRQILIRLKKSIKPC